MHGRDILDDDGGWALALIEGWRPSVRDAVVERLLRATVGAHTQVALTTIDPENAPAHWVEDVHDAVLAAIRDETGADLEELGSQAAWACYEETWDALAERMAEGPGMCRVLEHEIESVALLLRELPVDLAGVCGADTRTVPATPTAIREHTIVDMDGMHALIAVDDGRLTVTDRASIDALIAIGRRGGPLPPPPDPLDT